MHADVGTWILALHACIG